MKIEKVPYVKPLNDAKNRGRYGNSKYPWSEMKVGDSFYVEGYSKGRQNVLHTTGTQWFDRNLPGGKISTRKEGDGIRVYRIQ